MAISLLDGEEFRL